MTRKEFCENVLPSGNGFDREWWPMLTYKNGTEVFAGGYHNMNEHGYYDGWTQLTLYIPKGNISNFRLTLSGGKRKYMDYNMREYLNETIYTALRGRAFTFTDKED